MQKTAAGRARAVCEGIKAAVTSLGQTLTAACASPARAAIKEP